MQVTLKNAINGLFGHHTEQTSQWTHKVKVWFSFQYFTKILALEIVNLIVNLLQLLNLRYGRVLICNKLCVQGLKEHNLGLMKEVNQLIEFNLNFRQEKVCSIHCSLSAFLRVVSFYMLI